MSAQHRTHRLVSLLTASIMLAGTASVFAADPPKAPPEPSKETRQQMAAAHEKMAACLRSDKSLTECRNEMHQQCMNMMGGQYCPMMGPMMGKGGPMQGGMMNPPK